MEARLSEGRNQAEENVRKLAKHDKEHTAHSNAKLFEDVETRLSEGRKQAEENMHKVAENSNEHKTHSMHKVAENDKEHKKHSNAKLFEDTETRLTEGRKQAEENIRKLAEHGKEHKKHSNSKSNSGAEDSLAEYHPGWKLYELEGGQEAKEPQTEEERDLTPERHEQSDKKTAHQKHHVNVVSEAMGVAFGDSDSAQVTN